MVFRHYSTIMVRTQIQFEEATYQKLKERSRETGESISALVRRSLNQKLDDQEMDSRWQRALSSLGKFESGLRDLAEKHDSYMADRW